jgi:putative hydrolase of HD superfamily
MKHLEFLVTANALKKIPRSGWITHGVSLLDVESVADHTFSTCVISMLLTDLEQNRGVRVDAERVLRIATLHDLAEALTFDINKSYLTYLGKRGNAIKNEIETSAWKYLASSIGSSSLSKNYLALKEQYVSNTTIEAQIVHAADKIDILLQILELRRKGYPADCVKELWEESVRRISKMPIRSARKLLKVITKEGRRIA